MQTAKGEALSDQPARTFTDIVRERAAESPARPALILLTEKDGALRPETHTYAGLDRAARALAARIAAHAGPGERALILHRSRAQFGISFLACLYAGVVAVPAAPPGGSARHDERIAGIVKDAAASCVLTSLAEAPEVTQLLARTGHGSLTCIPTDTGHPAPQAHRPSDEPWQPARRDPDDPAFLQYTSGSTREPRGVVITHRALLAGHEAISAALGTTPGSRIGGWLPLHHDMGLVGQLLHALWLGGTAVLLSPVAFVKRPAHWLETISRYGLTVSGAPDFAYDLCVRRINDSQLAGLDLSGWRIAVNGGEPVTAATMRAFAERFAPAGLRPDALVPCYGLAEATLLVAGDRDTSAFDGCALPTSLAAGGPERETVSCGRPASVELRIVDPDSCEEVAEGHVGEIWVRGAAVARGYWSRPAETADVFGGRIRNGGSGYLRTGDLGALVDGRLHVTGRIKDVIVVAGRNLYPQDLERSIREVSALFGATAAFGVPGERERVVVVQELRGRSRYGVDFAELAGSVQSALTAQYDVRAGGVLLVRPGTVRRTTSGKLERAAMRRLFLNGELTALHQWLDPEVQRLVRQPPPRKQRGRR
ncbi:fatty acyl-AMP ligase [Streptomyces sp. NPDC049099]|uniref:fatty acyl-AMP ligase n=1 Tax=Streptomyces sp. NPDC049099 TaxID=3155768 RepID=UPI00341C2C38